MSDETENQAPEEGVAQPTEEAFEDAPQGTVQDAGEAAAIREGVTAKRLVEQRGDDIEELAAELAAERRAANPPGETEPEPEVDDQSAAAEGEQEIEPAPILREEDGETYITLKVDGVEQRMSIADAQAELQRRESGNRRLQEAASERVRLQQLQQHLTQREQQLQAAPPAPPEAPPPTEELDALAKEFVASTLDGDEDTAAEKLAKAVRAAAGGAGKPATPDHASIVEAAVQQVRRDQAIANDYNTFKSEYPDIINDPDAYAFADMVSDKVVAEHPEWTPLEVLREAGNRTRAFRNIQDAPSPETSRPEAQAAKSRLTRVPQSGGAAESVGTEPPKRKTPEQIVTEMNVQRRGKAAIGLT